MAKKVHEVAAEVIGLTAVALQLSILPAAQQAASD
jgi:hypothetical protein